MVGTETSGVSGVCAEASVMEPAPEPLGEQHHAQKGHVLVHGQARHPWLTTYSLHGCHHERANEVCAVVRLGIPVARRQYATIEHQPQRTALVNLARVVIREEPLQQDGAVC